MITEEDIRKALKGVIANAASEDFDLHSLRHPTRDMKDDINNQYPEFRFTEDELNGIFKHATVIWRAKYDY